MPKEPRDRNGRTRAEHAAWLDERAAETHRIAKAMPDMRPIHACVACGRLSYARWCSNQCFHNEDGYDPRDYD